jgi:hypothetical protein
MANNKAKVDTRKGGNILDFFHVKKIENGVVTYTTNKISKIMKVGCLNLAYLSIDDQRSKIRQMTNALNLIKNDCSIVKIERPIDLTDAIAKQERLYVLQDAKYGNNDMNEEGYKNRKQQVDFEWQTLKAYQTDYPVMVKEFYLVIYGTNLEDLNFVYDSVFEKMEINKLEPKRCSDSDIKAFFYYMFNPYGEKNEKDFVNNEDYKLDIMPQNLEFFGTKFKTDTMHASVFSTYEYPNDVPGAWLASVVANPDTTVVINARNVEVQTAKMLMDKAIREIRTQMLEHGKVSESMSQQTQLESFYAVLSDIERGNETLKLINIYTMNYARTDKELRANNRKVVSSLKQQRFKVDKLPLRQMQGLIAMLPTPRDDIILANGRDIPCSTLGAGFPFIFQGLNDKDGFLLGYNGAGLIFFDPKVRSTSRTNSNIMVIGKSGSGKSHFTKKMLLKLIMEDVKTYIVDPEGEYDLMTKKLGGQIIDVGSGNNSRINPFHIFGAMQESEDEQLTEAQIKEGFRSIFSNHIQFLEQFFQNLIPDLTNKELARLSKILTEAYERKGIKKTDNFELLKAEDFPIMDDAMAIVKEKIAAVTEIIVKDSHRSIDLGDELSDLRNCEVYLDRLCGEGSLSTLWNGPTTIDTSTSDLILFDFRKMTSSKNDMVMNSQMMLVLRFLENEVSKNRERNIAKHENHHVAIVVDEAHVFIDERSPAALYFMHQMIKRIRKYNGIFIVITQNVNDFVGSANIKKYTTSIINGCQYSFIFGLNPNDLQALMDLYASVGGFSDEEREFIANAGIGQCLFVVAPGQRLTMDKITVSRNEELVFKN